MTQSISSENRDILDGAGGRPSPLGPIARDLALGTLLETALARITTAESDIDALEAEDTAILPYVNPAASTAITGATETQANFDNASRSIPANRLKVGSIIKIRAGGRYTGTTGTEVHQLGVALDGTPCGESGNIDPATNDVWSIEIDYYVRAIGVSGTIVGVGRVLSGPPGAAATAHHVIAAGSGATSTTAIDTTAARVFTAFVDRQASATDADSMRCDYFSLKIED